MTRFQLHILGCGSALPTMHHLPSCQVLNINEQFYMIDCGDGAQLQVRANKISFNRLKRIFISHAHGDHCFGLMGLLSSFALLGRTRELTIHCVEDLRNLLLPQIEFFCRDNPFPISIEVFDPSRSEVIYQNRQIEVSTIPLKHRVPCAGFLFREKVGYRHLVREMLDYYHVPVNQLQFIKQGFDFVNDDGTRIDNKILTRDPDPVRSYAYCSDTMFHPEIVPLIKDVDLLYHEATYTAADEEKAHTRAHSTAGEAAETALRAGAKKLIIGHFSSRYTDESPLLKEARAIFGNTFLAAEKQVYDVGQ